LLNLDTGETKVIAPLLSKKFPNNFRQQADIYANSGVPVGLQEPSVFSIDVKLYTAFMAGIRHLLGHQMDISWLLQDR
jgi:hypothetical protein